MLEERAKIQRAKVKAVAEKRARERQERQKLTEAVLVSGLWQTEEQITAGLAGPKSKTATLKALLISGRNCYSKATETKPFSKLLSRAKKKKCR